MGHTPETYMRTYLGQPGWALARLLVLSERLWRVS
jgi:hypothetical protein